MCGDYAVTIHNVLSVRTSRAVTYMTSRVATWTRSWRKRERTNVDHLSSLSLKHDYIFAKTACFGRQRVKVNPKVDAETTDRTWWVREPNRGVPETPGDHVSNWAHCTKPDKHVDDRLNACRRAWWNIVYSIASVYTNGQQSNILRILHAMIARTIYGTTSI